jgi:hypothetical protein
MPHGMQLPSEKDGRYLPNYATDTEGLDTADYKDSKQAGFFKAVADQMTDNRVGLAELAMEREGVKHGLNPDAHEEKLKRELAEQKEAREHNRIFDMAKKRLTEDLRDLINDIAEYNQRLFNAQRSDYRRQRSEREIQLALALEHVVTNMFVAMEQEIGIIDTTYRTALRVTAEECDDIAQFQAKMEGLVRSLGRGEQFWQSKRYRVFNFWVTHADLLDSYYHAKTVHNDLNRDSMGLLGVDADSIDKFIQRYNDAMREARDINIQTKNRTGEERHFFLQDDLAKYFRNQLGYKLMGHNLAAVILQRI